MCFYRRCREGQRTGLAERRPLHRCVSACPASRLIQWFLVLLWDLGPVALTDSTVPAAATSPAHRRFSPLAEEWQASFLEHLLCPRHLAVVLFPALTASPSSGCHDP